MPIPRYSGSDPDDMQVVVTSAATVNATVGTWYRIDSTSTVTLVTPQGNGGSTRIENTSTSATITINRTGSDTIEGAASITLAPGTYADLTYRVSDTTWYRRQPTWEPTPGRNMRRDSAGRAQTEAPAVAKDIANKGYTDAIAKPLMMPRSGWFHHPSNMSGAGAAVAHTAGNVSFAPMLIGPSGTVTFSGLGVNCTTAQTGGATTVLAAIYPDAGDGTGPLCTGGPIRQVTLTVSATGNRVTAFGTPWTPPAGLYWTAFLYTVQTAPATTSQILHINGFVMLDIPSTSLIGAVATKGFVLASQTAMPTTDIRSSLTSVGNVAVVALQAA